MPCPCGSKNRSTVIGDTPIPADAGRANTIGMYELATYPDCVEPYSGTRASAGVFVVGRGRSGERLFLDAQAGDAARYAREINAPYIRVPARSLCDAAVRDLLASV